jgi:hypothetical protein
MKTRKELKDDLGHGEIVRAEPMEESFPLNEPLFHTAIYVNRAPQNLKEASHGMDASDPLTENRPWTTGERLLIQAREAGHELALIFGYYAELEYWAVATEIVIERDEKDKLVTRYRFARLRRIPGPRRERKDLTIVSKKTPLPNDYIRSYVLVQTPRFLHP